MDDSLSLPVFPVQIFDDSIIDGADRAGEVNVIGTGSTGAEGDVVFGGGCRVLCGHRLVTPSTNLDFFRPESFSGIFGRRLPNSNIFLETGRPCRGRAVDSIPGT
jgi:hypothetical protein